MTPTFKDRTLFCQDSVSWGAKCIPRSPLPGGLWKPSRLFVLFCQLPADGEGPRRLEGPQRLVTHQRERVAAELSLQRKLGEHTKPPACLCGCSCDVWLDLGAKQAWGTGRPAPFPQLSHAPAQMQTSGSSILACTGIIFLKTPTAGLDPSASDSRDPGQALGMYIFFF